MQQAGKRASVVCLTVFTYAAGREHRQGTWASSSSSSSSCIPEHIAVHQCVANTRTCRAPRETPQAKHAAAETCTDKGPLAPLHSHCCASVAHPTLATQALIQLPKSAPITHTLLCLLLSCVPTHSRRPTAKCRTRRTTRAVCRNRSRCRPRLIVSPSLFPASLPQKGCSLRASRSSQACTILAN